jgi:hypothetical protein
MKPGQTLLGEKKEQRVQTKREKPKNYFNLLFSSEFSGSQKPLKLDIKWRAPNSLRDSNVNPKLKTMEGQGVKAPSLARSTIKG